MSLSERIETSVFRAVARSLIGYERLRYGAAFDPLSREHHVDPHPGYRRLRERDPFHRSIAAGGWILSRYADVVEVLRNAQRFSSDERNWNRYERINRRNMKYGLPDPYDEGFASMLRVDPPDHTRLRTLVNKAFTARAVERMKPRIEAILKERVSAISKRGEMELVNDLAAPLPVIVIAEMLGVPSEDHECFRHWSDEAVRTLGDSTLNDVRRAIAARRELEAYVGRIVEERRRDPREDLITALVRAEEEGDRLEMKELFATILLLLVAGNETTTKLVANGTLALLRFPGEWEKLRARPELVPNAVEELLRYDGPVQLTSRLVLADGELRGKEIRKGQQLVLLLAGANRDPEQFPDADRLDVGRPSSKHLSFGNGIHFCLGAQLARLEATLAFQVLIDAFPRLRLAVPQHAIEWGDNSVLRGPKAVPLRF